MIKNIVFDMGQVLIRFAGMDYITQIGVPEEYRQQVLEETFWRGEWTELDRGTLTEEQAAASICSRLPAFLHGYIETLVYRWWQRPLVPIAGMAELIRELKGMGYGIYLLSNASLRLPLYFDRIPGAEYFDGRIVSAEWKLLKPERAIYQSLLDTYSLKAGECFFVDDLPANIAGAQQVGMQGAVFSGDVKKLRRELQAAGVPVAEASEI